MNTPPPPFDPSDDADEQYRRASELDPSRPSEATRRAVLDHAARLAAERARRDARRRWGVALAPAWRPAIVGTIAAAILAGVLIAPQFLAPTAPPESQRAPATAPTAPQALRQSAPVESARPASPAVTPERSRIPPSAPRAPLQESAPVEQAVADAGARRAVATTAAVSRAAPVAPPPAPPQEPAGTEALRQAAAAGDLVALNRALAGGGDIDARDAQGRTALMLATLNGQADAVAVLLAHGADPSSADADGTTPLQVAVAADEREIIAMLRRYGAR